MASAELSHMQVCTLLQTDNHASTPTAQFFIGRMPFLPSNQQRQSTEGKHCCHCRGDYFSPFRQRSAQLLFVYCTVIICLQVHSSGNPDIVDTFTGSHLVELSIVTAHCHDQIQDDIKNFADQLKPYPLVLLVWYCKQICKCVVVHSCRGAGHLDSSQAMISYDENYHFITVKYQVNLSENN